MNVMKQTVNMWDPRTQVTIVDVTKSIPPDTLQYNLMDKDRTLVSVEPDFEKYGDPTYEVARFYAERQLANNGGRTFKLVSPNKLMIKVSNGRGGSEYKTIFASKKRADGEWHEMTEEEIEEIESGVSAPLLSEETEKPADKPILPKGITKKVLAKKKKVAAQKSVETELKLEDEDAVEPTMDDILGN